MSGDHEQLGLDIINFDPSAPDVRDFMTATEFAAALAKGGLAEPVPWPPGLAPVATPPANAPTPSDPLPRADVLVVTWTAAEARTLSVLFTPGVPLEEWFEYKSNLDHFIPIVTGPKAPFNNKDPRQARYYHSLGLYYPVKLAGLEVLCLKSGLHMDYDGPQVPIVDFWKQVIAEVKPKLVITTGTGGGVGSNVLLGDVVVAAQTVFHCTCQFAQEPFHNAHYDTSPLSAKPMARVSAAMLKANADKVLASKYPSHPDGLPRIFFAGSAIATPKIVTTDFFAFDNTMDSNGLQADGNVCDMGDASLGLAISKICNPPLWAAIRNASDPQVDGSLSPAEQGALAGTIYRTYGSFTTAASVIATWSLICDMANAPVPGGAAIIAKAATAAPALAVAKSQQRERQLDPAHVLLQIAASTELSAKDIDAKDTPTETVAALDDRLRSINIQSAECAIAFRRLSFVDEGTQADELYLAQVSYEAAGVFRGSYLFSGTDMLAKQEFSS